MKSLSAILITGTVCFFFLQPFETYCEKIIHFSIPNL